MNSLRDFRAGHHGRIRSGRIAAAVAAGQTCRAVPCGTNTGDGPHRPATPAGPATGARSPISIARAAVLPCGLRRRRATPPSSFCSLLATARADNLNPKRYHLMQLAKAGPGGGERRSRAPCSAPKMLSQEFVDLCARPAARSARRDHLRRSRAQAGPAVGADLLTRRRRRRRWRPMSGRWAG